MERLSDEAVRAFAADLKIGLLATRDPQGLPHVSLLTSLQAADPAHLMFGQFCEGRSKDHLRTEPRAAFLVMDLQRRLWRGRARWTRAATEGADYIEYNRKPMFRYNAYFGIHTVHYLDVVSCTDTESVPMAGLVAGMLATEVARRLRRTPGERILKPWAERHFQRITTLKFVAHIGEDGFPWIIPTVPCEAAGSRRLVVAPTVHARELARIRRGDAVAVFALNLELESVLVRGRFDGLRAMAGGTAAIDLDWVYNSMPPQHGQIWPPVPLQAVTSF